MHDLAVQDGRPADEIPGDGLRQRFECFERISVARYQPAGTALDIGNSSKAIQFWLKNPIRMVEGRVEACQRHRRDVGEDHVTLF
jgi:hypothetical protein